MLDQVKESITFHMKKAGEKSLSSIKKSSDIALTTAKPVVIGGLELSPFIVDNENKCIPRKKIHLFKRENNKWKVFFYTDSSEFDNFFSFNTERKRIDYLLNHPFEMFQQLKIDRIPHMIEALQKEEPKELQEVQKKAKEFKSDFNTNIVPFFRDIFYPHLPKDHKPVYHHLINESLFIKVINRIFPNYNLLHIPATNTFSEPDIIGYNSSEIIFLQLKASTLDYKQIKIILDSFYTKYEYTDVCLLIVGYEVFIHINIFDNPTDLINRKCIGVFKANMPLNVLCDNHKFNVLTPSENNSVNNNILQMINFLKTKKVDLKNSIKKLPVKIENDIILDKNLNTFIPVRTELNDICHQTNFYQQTNKKKLEIVKVEDELIHIK